MVVKSKRKKLILRRLCVGALILLFSVLQNTDGWFPQVFGARAMLLIPAAVAAAMFEGEIAGMFFGLFAGALWDINAAGNNFNSIFLFVIAFICSALIQRIFRNNFVSHLLLSAVSSLIYSVGYWFFHYVTTGFDEAIFMLFRYFIPDSLYTIILSPVIFFMVRAIEKKFTVNEYAEIN